ncbi:MAG: hypothetical protein LBC98_01800, partial [Prevotellaceae bacterium]|nr:hypothetical protein [Prevotellaceae bacterium]
AYINESENNECFATKYFTVSDDNGKSVQIRVGNHSANTGNNRHCDRVLSFVTRKGCVHSGLGKGNMLYGEYVLVDGNPVENWRYLEDLLEYEDITE